MTAFDYVVIFVLCASLALGMWRGLVAEVLSLLAWILALVAAWHFGREVGALLTPLQDADLRILAGYVLVFVGVLLVLALIKFMLRSLLRVLGLGIFDRLLGVCFGLARGLLVVLILVAVGGMTSLPAQYWWRTARLAPPLETAVLAARPWLPLEIAKRIHFRRGA